MDERVTDALWERWIGTGDQDARNALVELYLPLVRREVARAARTVAPAAYPQLMSFGTVGLFDAIEKYRPERGHAFESYAPFRIRGAIMDGVRSLSWLPRGALKKGNGKIATVVTLDFQSVEPGNQLSLADSLVDLLEAPISDDVIRDAEHGAVADAVKALPERERHVISEYYYRGRRLAEIAGDMHVSESRICQIHRAALRLLQRCLAEPLYA